MIPNILSIAGSDPSGGAGIQADLKTFAALGTYGMAVITALTAQNTQGVSGVMDIPEDFVKQQLEAIFEDIKLDAIKIGMLSNAEIIKTVAELLAKYNATNIVLDPVMVATSGDSLISADAVAAMKEYLIPMADVLTPNIPEAEKLSRKAVLDMEEAAKGLLSLGSKAIYLKGGHLKGEIITDILADKDGVNFFEGPRVNTPNTHGTGCTLSSAIAAYLGHGLELEEACGKAKTYLTKALAHSDELDVGYGCGPVHHGAK